MAAIRPANTRYWGTTTNRILAPTRSGAAGDLLESNGDGTTRWQGTDLSASYSAATNTANLQAAVDAVNAAGGGVVTFPRGAAIKLGLAGASVYGATYKYCVRLKSNVTFDLNGATVSLGDNQSSAAAPCHMFECENAATNITIKNGTLKGNIANQTGTYGQGPTLGSTSIWFGSMSPSKTCSNVTLENLIVEEAYGNPIAVQNCTNVVLDRVRIDKCGEGFFIVGCTLSKLFRVESRNTTGVGVGDAIEVVNGTQVFLDGAIVDGWATGGLDITGVVVDVSHVTATNGLSAIVLQPNGASPSQTNSHKFLISNCAAYDCTGIGFLIMGNDASGTPCDGKISGCIANNCATGFNVTALAGSTKLVGFVEIENCTAIRGTTGLLIDSAKYVRVSGGSYSLNSGPGISLQFDRSGLADSDVDIVFNGVRSSNNGTYGLTLAAGATISPSIRGTLYMDGNAGTGITGNQDAQLKSTDTYSLNPNFQIRNLRPAGTPVAAKSQIPCNCDSIIYFSHSELRSLGNATHLQEVTVVFTATCSVNDVSVGSGRNISLVGGASVTFAANESLKLRYNGPAALWYEEWRQTGY